MSKEKLHKDFLYLTHTQGDARLWFAYDDGYTIILQLRVVSDKYGHGNNDDYWTKGRILYRNNSFVRANAVWVHLIRQDHKVWRMTQFGW